MTELTDADVFGPQSGELSDDQVFGSPQPQIPQAYIDRLRAGLELQKAIKHSPNSMVEPEGMTASVAAAFRVSKKIVNNFLEGYSEPEMPTPTGAILWDTGSNAFNIIQRLLSGGAAAIGGGAEQIARETGLPRPEQLGRDISGMAQLESFGVGAFREPVFTHAQFSRLAASGDVQRIGTLPQAQDFSDAATVLTHKPGSFTAFHGSPNEFNRFSTQGVDVTTDRNFAERYRQPRGVERPSEPGNLYQVNVNAKQDEFLNLDKPLTEQSQHVKEALGKAGIEVNGRLGMDAWDALRDAGDAQTAARTLQEAGLAGTSRAGGTYSVFDKDMVQITHRNDQSIAEENLQDLWEQRGIHPAEAVHDAQSDAFLREELTTPNPDRALDRDLERDPIGTIFELGEKAEPTPSSPAGAAVTPPEELPTLEEEPPPRAGSLVSRARDSIDKLAGLGRHIQFMLDPMATGTNRAMVVAKDAANAVRRIDWEWMRLDQEIQNSAALKAARDRLGETAAQQRERMWNAGDEESVALQLGEDRTHLGWATLEPEERYFMEYIDGLGQQAWLHAVDAGLVESEGLPAYMPRMMLNVATAEGKSPRALNALGRNVFTRTAQMLHREYMMAEETEEAMRARFGEEAGIARDIRALPLAIAKMEKAVAWKTMIDNIEAIGKATGEDTVAHGFQPDGSWFTIEGHPAFRKWKPDLEQGPDGTWSARKDEDGNVIFKPQQMWISPEFKGPLRAILDEPADKFKIVPGAPSAYEALMTLKGKAMTAILNSPLIHNEVVWGKVMEAAGGREWLGFNLYFRGNRIVNNPGRAGELIERGLNPIGPRGSFQDISAMMEEPNLAPGRSWTAEIARVIPDLFDPMAPGQTVGGPGDKVAAAIDKLGDFWHNTLLWDRVRDVQFGLADHLSDKLVNQGVNRIAADRIAAHFSNIIVGSLPKESMSAGAQATANLFLFSRSFTLGNLSTFKQAFTGLPKPIKAQLERDFGLVLGPEGEPAPIMTPEAQTAFNTAKSWSRRKALSTIALSAGLYYIGNALFENAFNIAKRDSSLEEEMNGYARRYHDFMTAVKQDPWELRHLLGRLSPTYDNEPQKSDRVHIGYDQDGTAIYGRLPFGKFGEEMVGYPTMPLEMLRRKLSPPAATALELLENDKGFGRKIYDDTSGTALNDWHTAIAVAKHIVMRELPEGQITAAADLLRGEGDSTVNKLRVFGPMAGFTASVGAPGGMAKGEQLAAKQAFETRFNLAWPDIKRQIQRGDIETASRTMMAIGVPMRMQRGLMRAATMPGNLSGRTLQEFFQYATPEQQQRFLNAR